MKIYHELGMLIRAIKEIQLNVVITKGIAYTRKFIKTYEKNSNFN